MNDQATKIKKKISELLMETQAIDQEIAGAYSRIRDLHLRRAEALKGAQKVLSGKIAGEQLVLFK